MGNYVIDNKSLFKSVDMETLGIRFVVVSNKPRKVIVNNPATIIIWEDGTKTVVKCGKNDTFDAEKGIAMCIVKKLMFHNKTTQMNKWFTKQVEEFDDHE